MYPLTSTVEWNVSARHHCCLSSLKWYVIRVYTASLRPLVVGRVTIRSVYVILKRGLLVWHDRTLFLFHFWAATLWSDVCQSTAFFLLTPCVGCVSAVAPDSTGGVPEKSWSSLEATGYGRFSHFIHHSTCYGAGQDTPGNWWIWVWRNVLKYTWI